MADISKITTLNGTTYNIKDAVARDSKVSSGIMEILNPFAPEQSQKLYIDRLENALYFADKRWIVTGTITSNTGVITTLSDSQIANLFDMGEENMSIPPAGGTLVLTIDFTGNDGTAVFPNYPYGILCMDFYYTAAPQSVSVRVYGKHTGSTSFWKTLTVTADPQNTTSQIRYRANQTGMYNMQKLEITVVAKSDSAASLSDVSYYLTRANKDKDMPYVSKLKPEKLYYNLTAPSFIGDLTGKVNNYTVNADVPSNAKFTDTTYESKTAVSGGTDVSLVTTGEKYTWDHKSDLTIGTTATTAAAGNHTHKYAGSESTGGAATLTAGIPFSTVDSTSTATAFTATVYGITTLKNGTICYIRNNKVTSAANCTININGLGAKPMYMCNAANARVTTQFAVNYTWILIYNSARVSGGCWDLVYLFDTNTTYSGMSSSEITEGTGTTNRLITPAHLKTAIQTWAPTIFIDSTEPSTPKTGDVWFKIVS